MAELHTLHLEIARRTTTIYKIVPGRLVLAVGESPWAFWVSYEYAPNVVILNPAMPGPKGPYRKLGFYSYDEWAGIDMVTLKDTISKLEPGVGGLPLAWGTVQDQDSQIPIRWALGLALRNLRRRWDEDNEYVFVQEGLKVLTDEEWQKLDRESGLAEKPMKYLVLYACEPSPSEEADLTKLTSTEDVLGVSLQKIRSVQVDMFEPHLSLEHRLHILLWGMSVRYNDVETRLLETGTSVSSMSSTQDLLKFVGGDC